MSRAVLATGGRNPDPPWHPPRIVLILTENWTMRPAPDVADLVTFAIEAERAGLDAVMVSEHVVAVIPVDGAAVAMDVGTLPFDPRVQVRPDPAP